MADVDISPELLKELESEFWKNYNGNNKINAAVEAQKSPESLNYKKAYNYSLEVGKSLTEALREKARSDTLPDGRMYYNIADKALRPMLENNYWLISDYCVKTQNALNERAGIGIKGVAAPINEDRVNGLLNVAAAAQQFDDVVGELCRECETYSLSVVDEHIRKNAEVQNSAGLSPKIERHCGHSGCDWCSSLAGTYEYEKVKDTGNDVFRRHTGCTCTVVFIPVNGKAENAHSKYYIPDKELLELRKKYVGVDRSGRGGIIEGKGKDGDRSGSGKLSDSSNKFLKVTAEAIKSIPEINIFNSAELNQAVHDGCVDVLKAVKELLPGTEATISISLDIKQKSDVLIGEPGAGTVQPIKMDVHYVSIHNHASGETFSGRDIRKFVADEKARVLCVVGNNGKVFVLEKTNNFDWVQFGINTHSFNDSDDFNLQVLNGAEQYDLRYYEK